MNLTKAMKRKMVMELLQANNLIDEKAYPSTKRIIDGVITDLDEHETKYEEWRAKRKVKK